MPGYQEYHDISGDKEFCRASGPLNAKSGSFPAAALQLLSAALATVGLALLIAALGITTALQAIHPTSAEIRVGIQNMEEGERVRYQLTGPGGKTVASGFLDEKQEHLNFTDLEPGTTYTLHYFGRNTEDIDVLLDTFSFTTDGDKLLPAEQPKPETPSDKPGSQPENQDSQPPVNKDEEKNEEKDEDQKEETKPKPAPKPAPEEEIVIPTPPAAPTEPTEPTPTVPSEPTPDDSDSRLKMTIDIGTQTLFIAADFIHPDLIGVDPASLSATITGKKWDSPLTETIDWDYNIPVEGVLTAAPEINASAAEDGIIRVTAQYVHSDVALHNYAFEWRIELTYTAPDGTVKTLTLTDKLAHGLFYSRDSAGTARLENGVLRVESQTHFSMLGQSNQGSVMNSLLYSNLGAVDSSDYGNAYIYPGDPNNFPAGIKDISWSRDGEHYTFNVSAEYTKFGPGSLRISHQPHLDWEGTLDLTESINNENSCEFSIPEQKITSAVLRADGTYDVTETHIFRDVYKDSTSHSVTVSGGAPFVLSWGPEEYFRADLTVTVTRTGVPANTKSEVALKTVETNEWEGRTRTSTSIGVLDYSKQTLPATLSLRAPAMAAAAPAPTPAPVPAPVLPAGNRLENVRAEGASYVFDTVHTFTDLPGEPESIRFFRDGAQIRPNYTTTMAQDVLTVTVQDQQLPAGGSGTIRCELWYGGRCRLSRELTVNQSLLEIS